MQSQCVNSNIKFIGRFTNKSVIYKNLSRTESLIVGEGIVRTVADKKDYYEVVATCMVGAKTPQHAQVGDKGFLFKDELKNWKQSE